MAFIEPMHRNKPNITYLLISQESRGGYIFIRECRTLGHISQTIWIRFFKIHPNNNTCSRSIIICCYIQPVGFTHSLHVYCICVGMANRLSQYMWCNSGKYQQTLRKYPKWVLVWIDMSSAQTTNSQVLQRIFCVYNGRPRFYLPLQPRSCLLYMITAHFNTYTKTFNL